MKKTEDSENDSHEEHLGKKKSKNKSAFRYRFNAEQYNNKKNDGFRLEF